METKLQLGNYEPGIPYDEIAIFSADEPLSFNCPKIAAFRPFNGSATVENTNHRIELAQKFVDQYNAFPKLLEALEEAIILIGTIGGPAYSEVFRANVTCKINDVYTRAKGGNQ